MPSKPYIKYFLLTALAVLLGLCLWINLVDLSHQRVILSRFKPERRIALENPGGKEATPAIPRADQPLPELRVAIAPIFSPEVSLRLYKDIVDCLGHKLGMKTVIMQRGTYAEINELLRDKICQIAFVCTFPFIRGEQDFGMELLAVPQIRGKTTFNALIIVNRTSPARTLLDLQGKKFATADIFSSTGWLYPATWLAERGKNPKAFFSSLVITGSHDGSIAAVSNGYAEGASVNSMVFDQMVFEDSSLLGKLRVIQHSPDYGAPPVVVYPQLDAALKARIAEALFRMDEEPEGKQALKKPRIDKYVKPEEKWYGSVREAVKLFEAHQ